MVGYIRLTVVDPLWTDDSKESWAQIEIKLPFERRQSSSDGSKRNPKISEVAMLPKLRWAKEVAYQVNDGTPGLTIRQGLTRHNYSWIPIISSPIASRTSTRL